MVGHIGKMYLLDHVLEKLPEMGDTDAICLTRATDCIIGTSMLPELLLYVLNGERAREESQGLKDTLKLGHGQHMYRI